MPTVDDFLSELRSQFRAAQERGARYVTINAGELHRRVGGYPSRSGHRMPVCCDVMYRERRNGDEIITAPPKGKGARLTIRYCLPR
jgi:hypothetical protein